MQVAWELSFHIFSEYSLTEPHVSHALSDMLVSETALFIGNSMPIRDADMYARGIVNCTGKAPWLELPLCGINVAGNRGASGIDGLLSTAAGFAVGCKKRVNIRVLLFSGLCSAMLCDLIRCYDHVLVIL